MVGLLATEESIGLNVQDAPVLSVQSLIYATASPYFTSNVMVVDGSEEDPSGKNDKKIWLYACTRI
jgi:hypothetical protein